MFNNIYKGKRVFLTGHSGFKGSWLALWLEKLGAEVFGYSLRPEGLNHFSSLQLDIEEEYSDIRNLEKLENAILRFQPDIVFHLAAQPLVRRSYSDPIETYTTNIIGSLHLYESCRKCSSVKAIVSITTDKVYKNKEWDWAYRENEELGGYDPYSSSKAAVEIMSDSYRNSYFNINNYGKTHNVLLATVRAGNVIGGGDWSEDRLIPDLVRSCMLNKKIEIRFPESIRPWQHVLESLSGYLLIGQKLLERKTEFAKSWNIGPEIQDCRSVIDVLEIAKKEWSVVDYVIKNNNEPHEASLLKLDCTNAKKYLNWQPVWNLEKSVKETISWYKAYANNEKIVSTEQLNKYINDAISLNIKWTI